MSPLAKVFVFLVTFLNICFLGVSATLYQVQMDWKEVAVERQAKVEELKGSAKEELEKTRGERDIARDNHNAVKTANAALEASNEALTNENRDLKANQDRLEQTIAQRDTQIQQKDSHIQQLDGEKADLIGQNDRLRGEIDDAQQAMTAAELAMNRALLDRQQVEEQALQYQTERVAFKEQVDELTLWRETVLKNNPNLITVDVPATPVETTVVAVKADVDLIVLGAGSDDNVKVGDLFTIYRGGNFIAKARVVRTTGDLAGARILFVNDGQSIEVADQASSRLAY